MGQASRYRVRRSIHESELAEVLEAIVAGEQDFERRVVIKRLIAELETEIPNIRSSMLTALGNAVPTHLLDPDLFDFKSLSAGTGDIAAELDLAIGHTDEGLSPALVSIA